VFLCLAEFCFYLYRQWIDGNSGSGATDDLIAEKNVEAMRDGHLTLRGAMARFREHTWSTLCGKGDLEETLLNKESMDEVRRMCKVLAPFFAIYDRNGDNQIDFDEFRMIFKDVHENLSKEGQWRMFNAADTDNSGFISFEEFVACLMSFALDPCNDLKEERTGKKTMTAPTTYLEKPTEDGGDGKEDEEGAEEEDMPEDLADLEPEEQQRRIRKRAMVKMGLGTLLVLIFSDPMVDLLSDLGKRTGVPAFYVSFLLAPLASNASEVVAAFNYAQKRTAKSMTTSLATLLGAGVMNNTFCLGIFLALVYCKKLAWTFTAETLSIILVQLLVAAMALSLPVQTLLHAFVVLSFYPLCLGVVYMLENWCGLD